MPSQFNIAKLNTSKNLLLLILLVASVLRCWNIFDIPYTNDEMSALMRTRYDSFGELINLGVRLDAHPAGIQVFMYYWVSLFGEQAWIVKSPFIVMGVAALYYNYKLAFRWFNESVALISTSFLAILQFPVMYSQIARPYVSGLFFILAFTYYLNQLTESKSLNRTHFIFATLFGALCAYNHHFSLLLAGLIGVGFLVSAQGKIKKSILWIGGFIALLYVPHLEIFLYQLNIGGVGEWLGAPTWDFGWRFLKYAFHYSYIILILIVTLNLAHFMLKNKNSEFPKKWFRFSLLISLVYFSIGFFYSIFKNPIIQFSMMLYIFPFILFIMFSRITELQKKFNLIIVIAVLTIGTSSLIFERNHYYTFYHTRYFQMIDDMHENPNENSDYILTNIPKFVTFYEQQNPSKSNIKYVLFDKDSSSILHFNQLLNNCNNKHLMIGLLEQSPKEILSLSLEKFPFVVKKNEYHGASTYWLSKTGSIDQQLVYHNHKINYETKNKSTLLINSIDSLWNLNNKSYSCLNNEYSLGLEVDLKKVVQHPYDIIIMNAKLKIANPNEEVLLVAEFSSKGSKVGWRASSSFNFTPDSIGIYFLSVAIDRNTFDIPIDQELILKSFIWNPSKGSVQVVDLNLHLIEGNRNKYSLYDPIYRY
jgi:hypothetical protein